MPKCVECQVLTPPALSPRNSFGTHLTKFLSIVTIAKEKIFSRIKIMSDLVAFTQLLEAAVRDFQKRTTKTITVVHHVDADGLASGAILKLAFEREGFKVTTKCLEKIYPEAATAILQEKSTIVFGDLASSFTTLLNEHNKNQNLILILDHHQFTEEALSPNIINVNPERCGFSGSSDISGAGVCYLFAKKLNPANADLAAIAMIGNCEIPGQFRSLNLMILEEARNAGVLRGQGRAKSDYDILLPCGKWYNLWKLFITLNTVGPVGFYSNGPEVGIEICYSGLEEEQRTFINSLEIYQKSCYDKLFAKLEAGEYGETDHVLWIDAGKLFHGMGTKVIGLFLSAWRKQLPGYTEKYLIAMMDLQQDIPGITRVAGNIKKVSGRLPDPLLNPVLEGTAAPFSYLFAKAGEHVGGFGDGHKAAASAAIPADSGQAFIDRVETLISTWDGGSTDG